MPEGYDAVVVGAGPAGSATACLLAEQGHHVLLLDRARFPRPKACAEYVSPGAVAILERLGVLSDLRAGRWLEGMHIVAPSGARWALTYTAEGRALSVPRTDLDTALVRCARQRGVELREGFLMRGLLREGRVRGVVGADGCAIQADLVVGADGVHSTVARQLGVAQHVRWPRRLGLTAHLRAVPWPEAHGQMWVGPHGYAGVAPLDDAGLLSVGVVMAIPGATLGDPRRALWRVIEQFPDLARRLSAGRLVDSVRGTGPLARRVRTSAGQGFALVGDAAGFFDPFTGEGIFRALRGAELLATCGPRGYAAARRRAFASKERLTALIQLFVQVPRLMEWAVARLQQRPAQALRLANMLGDLEPADLGVVWRLLAPAVAESN